MRGDELVSLLGSYVSSLENVVLQDEGPSANDRSLLAALFREPSVAAGDNAGTNDSLARSLSGMATSDAAPAVDDLAEATFSHMPTMRSWWSGPSGSEIESMMGGTANSDRIASGISAAVGGGFVPSGLSALFDMFRGATAANQLENYEMQHYTWETPSRPVEGLVDGSSRVASIDSAYDGSLRAVERDRTTGSHISVRIEALDARSFLERKEDIAEAVRQAMLTSGALGATFVEY